MFRQFLTRKSSKLEDNKKSDKNKAPDKVGSDSVSGFDNYHFLE